MRGRPVVDPRSVRGQQLVIAYGNLDGVVAPRHVIIGVVQRVLHALVGVESSVQLTVIQTSEVGVPARARVVHIITSGHHHHVVGPSTPTTRFALVVGRVHMRKHQLGLASGAVLHALVGSARGLSEEVVEITTCFLGGWHQLWVWL